MKHKAGLLKIILPWTMIMLDSLEAVHSLKNHANKVLSCNPKQLTSLAKSEVEKSLTKFDDANGQHLGTWPPGFPELTVDQNSSPVGDKVQCSLLFLTQGLEKILEDQKNNLNPEDVSLHEMLSYSIDRVKLLRDCLKEVLGGNCSSKSPPEMPKLVFERKQWSHTLLKMAKHYLDWLQHKLVLVKRSKVNWTVKNKKKATKPRHQAFLEGSGYLL